MASMIVHYKVKSFSIWKPIFDDHESVRQAAGLTNPRVYQATNDMNDLVIVLDVTDVAKAKEFGSSQDLKDRMESAGVIGTPTVHFLTESF